MEKVRLLIVDDHELILNGLRSMFQSFKDFEIVGDANNGKDAITQAQKLQPDVIFMDLSMPVMSGLEATSKIVALLPETKILALTQHEDSEYVMQMLQAGGKGYLFKNSTQEEFKAAIHAVMNGQKYFSKKISDMLLNDLMNQQKKHEEEAETKEVPITKREREIIINIANDLSNQQIADKLNISLRTVETHRRNIMQKLKVNTVVALIKYAVQHNIVSLD